LSNTERIWIMNSVTRICKASPPVFLRSIRQDISSAVHCRLVPPRKNHTLLMLNVQPHASTSCSVSDRTGWATVAYLSYLISDLYGPRSEPLNAICSFAVTVRPIS